MLRGPVSRLFCATFILVVSGGGGELPALDGLLFHGREGMPATVVSHYEAWGGCHADQCAIRATAQHPPLTPTVAVPALTGSEPGAVPLPAIAAELLPAFPVFQPFSRAPPRLQV